MKGEPEMSQGNGMRATLQRRMLLLEMTPRRVTYRKVG